MKRVNKEELLTLYYRTRIRKLQMELSDSRFKAKKRKYFSPIAHH